jgi:hypothetical protein
MKLATTTWPRWRSPGPPHRRPAAAPALFVNCVRQGSPHDHQVSLVIRGLERRWRLPRVMGWDAVGLNSLHGRWQGFPNRLGGSCIYTMASRPTVLVTVKLSVQVSLSEKAIWSVMSSSNRRPSEPHRGHGGRWSRSRVWASSSSVPQSLQWRLSWRRLSAEAAELGEPGGQGRDRTADLAVFSRARLVRRRPARFACVAFALVGTGADRLIVQGDTGSCGSMQISRAEPWQNRTPRPRGLRHTPARGGSGAPRRGPWLARETPAGCPRQASPPGNRLVRGSPGGVWARDIPLCRRAVLGQRQGGTRTPSVFKPQRTVTRWGEATPCLQSQIGRSRHLRGKGTTQVEGAGALSGVSARDRTGPLRMAR